MAEEGTANHQVLVRLLDGKHRTLNLTCPSISIESLKHKIETLTSIPSHLQLLLLPNYLPPLRDHQTLDLPTGTLQSQSFPYGSIRTLNLTSGSTQTLDGSLKGGNFQVVVHQNLNLTSGSTQTLDGSQKVGSFPVVVHLLLRLRGGKGGFGSLLRGAATKAGQKKTNNFDACRDMSGRRLRHVNAEKRLEEWKAEAEERRLEKTAEEFIKKKDKELKKKGGRGGKGGDDVNKYVQKYREDSARCMEEVERSVRESLKGFVGSKRKGAEGNGSDSKKLKIWMGKRNMDDSDNEDLDDNSDEEDNEKSAVINNGNNSDSSREAEGSSGSVTYKMQHKVVSPERGTPESGTEEEKEYVTEESPESGETLPSTMVERECATETVVEIHQENIVPKTDASCANTFAVSTNEPVSVDIEVYRKYESDNVEEKVGEPTLVSSSAQEDVLVTQVKPNSSLHPVAQEDTVVSEPTPVSLEPLNFDKFNSAIDLEALGMDRLKFELQARGLKCGGTLQERAARLFLLKTTPLERLPKKLLAKK